MMASLLDKMLVTWKENLMAWHLAERKVEMRSLDCWMERPRATLTALQKALMKEMRMDSLREPMMAVW